MNGPCQVGDEGDGTLQCAQQQQVFALVVPGDLLTQFGNLGANPLFGNKNLGNVVVQVDVVVHVHLLKMIAGSDSSNNR